MSTKVYKQYYCDNCTLEVEGFSLPEGWKKVPGHSVRQFIPQKWRHFCSDECLKNARF